MLPDMPGSRKWGRDAMHAHGRIEIEASDAQVAPAIVERLAAAPAPRDQIQALGDQLADDLAGRLAKKGWRLERVTLAADGITVAAAADRDGETRRFEAGFTRRHGDVGKAILAWLQSLEHLGRRR
jgi:hypothetical protein